MPKLRIVIEKDRFREIAEKMRPALQQIKRQNAERVAELAKQNAPVLSGELRDSIKVFEKGRDVMVGSDVFYAAWQEFGVPQHHLPAVRYMGRARDAVYPQWQADLGDMEAKFR